MQGVAALCQQRKKPSAQLSEQVIGAAIEVHKHLGPGLMESVYEECLCHELSLLGLKLERQVPLPIRYKGVSLALDYRLDLVVESVLLIALKAVEKISAVHEAQLLTYLRLSGIRVGLLMNFCAPSLHDGLRRRIL
ncbi:MAG: GxxExxY protein [Phycisphaerales bacterium]